MENEEGCSIPISSEQFTKDSSDMVVATKLLSFPHRSGLYSPSGLYAAKELADRLLAAAAPWKVITANSVYLWQVLGKFEASVVLLCFHISICES